MSKICTDIPQSKILAEILSLESADMHYVKKTYDFSGNPVDGKWSEPKYGNQNSKYANYIIQNFESYERIPCWSLAALLDILQNAARSIDEDGSVTLDSYKTIEWHLGINNSDLELVTKSNPVDACYEMLVLLHKENLI